MLMVYVAWDVQTLDCGELGRHAWGDTTLQGPGKALLSTVFLCRKRSLVLLNLPRDDGSKKGSKEGKQTLLKAVGGPVWEGALGGFTALEH